MSRTAMIRRVRVVMTRARRLLPATRGATTIEYALLAGLIALVILGALGNLGNALVALPLPALVTALGG